MELQGVVDEVVRSVYRLNGRLSDEACWTSDLQEEAEASRQMVEGLVAQVNHSVQHTYIQGNPWSLCTLAMLMYLSGGNFFGHATVVVRRLGCRRVAQTIRKRYPAVTNTGVS